MRHRYTVPGSDSEADSDQLLASAPSGPSENILEKALRGAVARIYHNGRMEDLTVRRVREAVEKSLGLDEGFFKRDTTWTGKSNWIIKDEVSVQDRVVQEGYSAEPITTEPEQPHTGREPGDEAAKVRRVRRISSPESEYESPSESESEATKPTGRHVIPVKRVRQRSPRSQAFGDSDIDVKSTPKLLQKGVSGYSNSEKEDESSRHTVNGNDSESEMSVVMDEKLPVRRRKAQKSPELPEKRRKRGKGRNADHSTNQAEIKRLQGWLVKCGIRKVWTRELAPFETNNAKIKHLKAMLNEAGMEGRYSIEKAKRIRDMRELKADLETVQEGAKRWGRSEDDASGEERPRRKRAPGRKSLAIPPASFDERSIDIAAMTG